MFSVKIDVVPSGRGGLEALDERRRLGLPESTKRLFRNGENGGAPLMTIPVSETFARDRSLAFRNEEQVVLRINSSELKPGEVKEDRCMLFVAGEFPEYRLVELWPIGTEFAYNGINQIIL
jgi:hypothetical protein